MRAYESLSPNDILVYISFMNSKEGIIAQVLELISSCDNYQIVLNSDFYIFSRQFRQTVGDSVYKLCVEAVAEHAAL